MKAKKRVLPKTWEEYCKLAGSKAIELPDVSLLAETIGKRVIADFKLSAVILYCNGGVLADFTNYSQWKYVPWWRVVIDANKPSGFGLSYLGYVRWYTFTYVGPRFAFLDSDHVGHVAKYFIEEYNNLIL